MVWKKLAIGSLQLTVLMEDRHVNRLRDNPVYRYFIRPALNILRQGEGYRKHPTTNGTAEKQEAVTLVDRKVTDDSVGVKRTLTSEQEALLSRIAGIDWYHSIDLGHGIVTPGAFDHNPKLHDYRLPDTLQGKRVLDVATFDGFWAFEFEKRGAAEVVAMDIESFHEIDLPPVLRAKVPEGDLNMMTGAGFALAKESLGSRVRRQIMNVYELSPEKTGMFDMAFCSDLLLHLMNPMKALQNIRSVVTAYAYIVEPFDPELDLCSVDDVLQYRGASEKCIWWMFGLRALEHMIRDAGFGKVELLNTFTLGYRGQEEGLLRAVFKASP